MNQRGVTRDRSGRTLVAVVIYLSSFGVLLAVVSQYYLIPALKIKQGATADQQRILATSARLILAVVLFVLLMGLLLTFRIGRFFFPAKSEQAKPTKYVDAWQEAGRRIEVPDDEDEEADDENA